MTPDLSVVIVNWNGRALLPACLGPLQGQGFEVLVVDNGSTDDSLALLAERFPDVIRIRNDTNVGFARANNHGIAAATGRHVLLLNNDTVPDADACRELTSFLDRHPTVGVVGPTLTYPDGRRQPSCGPGPNLATEFLGKTLLHRVLPGLREQAPMADRRVGWVTGAALVIRRSLAAELGGLDAGMFMFYEDLDLCARVREAGYEVWFVATRPIVHIGGASRRQVEVMTLVQSYRSADRFFRRHGPSWRHRVLRAATIPEVAARSFLWAALGALGRRPPELVAERQSAYRQILREMVR